MFDTTFTCGIDPKATKIDLEAGVYDADWPSEQTRKKKRATLNTSADVFEDHGLTTPEEMPSTRAEIEFFFDKYLKAGNFPPKSRLKTVKQAERWMKDYCVVADVVNGARAAKMASRQLGSGLIANR